MTARTEFSYALAGARVALPCGHELVVPWNLAPEAALAEMLQHESECELDPGIPVAVDRGASRPRALVVQGRA